MRFEVLRRNLGLKLSCLAAAILLYFVANNQVNPQTAVEVLLRPRFVNTPKNLVVVGEVVVPPLTISGPAALVDGARKRQIPARVDLSNATEGVSRLPVEYDLPDGVRRRIPIDGDESLLATVTLERKEQGIFAVDVLHNESALAGYRYAEAVTKPSKVEVSGRAADVRRVRRVVADVQNTTDRGAIDREVKVTAQDEKSRQVEGVTITPDTVRVAIDLERQPTTKTLLLSLSQQGKPAPGFELYDYALSPSLVTVRGSQDALRALSTLSVRIDVTGIAESTTRTVTIDAPPGITIDGSDQVRVRLEVRAIAGSQSPSTLSNRVESSPRLPGTDPP